MTDHTPGPWVTERAFDHKGKHVWLIRNEGGNLIVERGIYNKADANLMAASPEMLDFLYELAVMRTESIPADLQAQASALIRKAEGRDD